uniref:Uncharacterized protein n=1 Tax=Meloidogyne incognita TaxID=6306 RepID=A0A914KIN5_MELIC
MSKEGVAKLFNGCTMATGRAILMTIGQLSFYDQIKQMLIKANLEKDNIYTHLFSFLAASGATVLIQPMDVLRTRLMNAPPGQFKGLLDCFLYTAKLGPLGFFKGLDLLHTQFCFLSSSNNLECGWDIFLKRS